MLLKENEKVCCQESWGICCEEKYLQTSQLMVINSSSTMNENLVCMQY